MKITRQKNNRGSRYRIDDKIVSRDEIDEICKKFLTAEGLVAMWCKVFDYGVCVLDFDFDGDENKILAKKIRSWKKNASETPNLKKS